VYVHIPITVLQLLVSEVDAELRRRDGGRLRKFEDLG